MKELTFTYTHMARHVTIEDNAKADAAYAVAKAALDEYRDYGNDKSRTIEVDYGHSVETIVVGSIASVSIADLEAGEDIVVRKEIWKRRMEAKVTAALQPAAE